MKTIILKCRRCEKQFKRKLSEHNKNIRLGLTKTFCSLSCSAYTRNASMSKEYWKNQYSNRKIKPARKPNELSPFKYYINKCKSRKKDYNIEYDIDVFYLKEIWEKQNGICPYTKLKMLLPPSTSSNIKCHSLKRASLDRIDSNKGYIKGNVEFICLGINFAKNDYTKKETEEFIAEIMNSPVKLVESRGT